MQRVARKHWTWDDYVRLPEDGKRYEIIEGDLVMMAGPSYEHQAAGCADARAHQAAREG